MEDEEKTSGIECDLSEVEKTLEEIAEKEAEAEDTAPWLDRSQLDRSNQRLDRSTRKLDRSISISYFAPNMSYFAPCRKLR